jgi:hypothetical protein
MQVAIPAFRNPLGESAILLWTSPAFSAALFLQDGVRRLSIARATGIPDLPMSWEELMQVKRDCGFGHCDALEVYPRDADIFNTGNVRHLYLVGEVSFALRKNTHGLQSSNPRV